jgi:hypothetical protein
VERSRRAFQGAQIAATVTIGVAVTTGLGQSRRRAAISTSSRPPAGRSRARSGTA